MSRQDLLVQLQSHLSKEHRKNLKNLVDNSFGFLTDDFHQEINEREIIAENDKLYIERNKKAVKELLVQQDSQSVIFIIGNKYRYRTSRAVIERARMDSVLRHLQPDEHGTISLVRKHGKLFNYVLEALREGSVPLPPPENPKRTLIVRELEYFGVQWKERDDIYGTSVKQLKFDPIHKHTKLNLSASNTTVTHLGGEGHATIVANKVFTSGVHSWKVRVNGPTHWVVLGVCLKSNLSGNYTSDYSHAWCCGSSNYQNKMAGTFCDFKTGTVFTVKLDLKKKTLTVTAPPSFSMSAKDLPSGEYLAFFNLYTNGNSLSIVN